jgi:hypothetical protein
MPNFNRANAIAHCNWAILMRQLQWAMAVGLSTPRSTSKFRTLIIRAILCANYEDVPVKGCANLYGALICVSRDASNGVPIADLLY